MAYLLHVIKADELFVDVGANVGSYTVLACTVKQARGCCFEPIPLTYARLNDNLVLNNLSTRVTAHNVGLADVDGELMFTVERDCMNHVVQPGDNGEKAVAVPVRTLDSMLAGESPAVIKIDVEGFETPVLKGASSVLANPSLHSVLMELNGSGLRYGYDERWIVDLMHSHGFSGYMYDPFKRELSPISGKSDATNTIFIRGAERIAALLKNAPLFQVGSHSI